MVNEQMYARRFGCRRCGRSSRLKIRIGQWQAIGSLDDQEYFLGDELVDLRDDLVVRMLRRAQVDVPGGATTGEPKSSDEIVGAAMRSSGGAERRQEDRGEGAQLRSADEIERERPPRKAPDHGAHKPQLGLALEVDGGQPVVCQEQWRCHGRFPGSANGYLIQHAVM